MGSIGGHIDPRGRIGWAVQILFEGVLGRIGWSSGMVWILEPCTVYLGLLFFEVFALHSIVWFDIFNVLHS